MVCVPGVRPSRVTGEVQLVKGPPSKLHSKVEVSVLVRVMVTVVSRVVPSGAPVMVVVGPVVSTVNTRVGEGMLSWPMVVEVAVMPCEPSGSVVASQLQVPDELVVAVHNTVVPSRTVMVLPGSAVPVMVGVASGVTWLVVGPVMTGVEGAVASMVKWFEFEAIDTLPAASLATALATCMPVVRSIEGVHENAPLVASAVAVQTTCPSTETVTVLPGSAVPDRAGRRVVEVDPSAGVVSTGALGAVVSTVKV